MILRFVNKSDPSIWYEYKEDNGKVVNRNCWVSAWQDSVLFKTFDEVRLYFNTQGKYSEVSDSTPRFIDPNDLQLDPKLPEGKHKCYCSWDKVWREGCQCDGI